MVLYMRKISNLSELQIRELQRIYGDDAEIAKEFNITRQAVCKARKKMGVESYRYNTDRDGKIVTMYRSGATANNIAHHFCLSVRHVRRIIARSR